MEEGEVIKGGGMSEKKGARVWLEVLIQGNSHALFLLLFLWFYVQFRTPIYPDLLDRGRIRENQ